MYIKILDQWFHQKSNRRGWDRVPWGRWLCLSKSVYWIYAIHTLAEL
jgi:hypothetical protein